MDKEVFRTLFVIAVIVVLVFFMLRAVWRSVLDGAAADVREKVESALASRTDFVASHAVYSVTSNSLLALDEQSLQLTQYFVQGPDIRVRTVRIDSILDSQLLVDELAYVTGLGAAVSAESSMVAAGTAFTQTDVKSIALRILLNDTQVPVIVHEFLSSAKYGKFESASGYVREAMTDATRSKALLDVLVHRARSAL